MAFTDAMKKVGGALGVALGGKASGGGSCKGDEEASYKKGGVVRKTGPAKVHKGERVLTKKQNKSYKK